MCDSVLLDCGYDLHRINSVNSSLETPPKYTFLRINSLKLSDDQALLKVQEHVDLSCEKKKWPRFQVKKLNFLKDVLYIESKGPFDLVHDKEITSEIVIDHFCAAALLRGADIYSSGIINGTKTLSKGDKAAIYIDLDGKCLRSTYQVYQGLKQFFGYGIMTENLRDIFKKPRNELEGVGVLVTDIAWRAPCLGDLNVQGIFLQNLTSILASIVLDPQPNELILDMCAAPGGKSMHLATLSQDKARIISLDKSKNKILRFKSRLESEGYSQIHAFVSDSCSCVAPADESLNNFEVFENILLENPLKLPKLPRGYFDRVLLDGPCSALGQRPNLKFHGSKKLIEDHSSLQKSFFHAAVKLLKPGGTLLYSTCTISAAENEENVIYALKTFKDQLELLDIPEKYKVGQPGLKEAWIGASEADRLKVQRFDPDIRIAGDFESIGFFFALFRKK